MKADDTILTALPNVSGPCGVDECCMLADGSIFCPPAGPGGSPSSVPSLSTWGAVVLGLALAAAAAWRLR